MRLLVVIALLAACTLHVEMEVRSVSTSSATHAAAQLDASAAQTPSLYYGGIGLYASDGGVSSLSIGIGGCEPTTPPGDAGFCESPCEMPLVNCGQWSSMQYDGCRWRCEMSSTFIQVQH